MSLRKYLTLARLLRNERLPPQALAEMQAAKLRRLVQHAALNVPFYTRLFAASGVEPADIRTPADLQKLPVVDKDMLRSQPLEDLVDRRLPRSAWIDRYTSGSSGSPFHFVLDRSYDEHCKAQYLRPYLSNGRSLGDRLLHFTSWMAGKSPPWFSRVGALRSTRVDCSLPAQELLAVVRREQAELLQGYPSVLTSIASRIDPANRGFRPPRTVFTDSELLTPVDRRIIERAFGAPVLDVFGTFETDNIAYQCGEGGGYHLAIDCVVLEFIRDGQPVAPGEHGNLVCTVLNNTAMPLIRYALGDIGSAATRGCACGRTLPLMNVIEGRDVDRVRMPDGSTRSPMKFLVALDALHHLALEYQVVQTSLFDFTYRLVTARALTEADRGYLAGLIRAQHAEARVHFELVDHIGRERSGKRRTFISRI